MIQAGIGTKIELAVHRTLNAIMTGPRTRDVDAVPRNWAEAMKLRNSRMLRTLAGRTQEFRVLEHERLDPFDSQHATWRLRFSGSGRPDFQPGDMVYLRWRSEPADVERVLELLGATGDEPAQFKTATSRYMPGWLETATLRDALSRAVELQEASTAMLRYYGMDEIIRHNKAMDELHNKYHREASRNGYLTSRHPQLDYKRVDLLSLLASGRRPVPGPAEFLALQDRIFARCYTMSDFRQVSEDNFEFEITVSQAEKEVLDAEGWPHRVPARSSNFLSRVQPGDTVEGWLLPEPHRFAYTLGRDVETIAICTGSGISSVLSLLRTCPEAGNIHLVYGIRSWKKKSLYGAELEGYLRAGRIRRLDAVSSRPEPGEGESQRVQHFVWNHRQEIAESLRRGAHIYLCGRLSMGEETVLTLADVLVDQGFVATQAEGLRQLETWHNELRLQASVSGV